MWIWDTVKHKFCIFILMYSNLMEQSSSLPRTRWGWLKLDTYLNKNSYMPKKHGKNSLKILFWQKSHKILFFLAKIYNQIILGTYEVKGESG